MLGKSKAIERDYTAEEKQAIVSAASYRRGNFLFRHTDCHFEAKRYRRYAAHAILVAETLPGATCSITVYYKSGPSSAAGLEAKIADSSGRVSWTWTVGSRTTPGTWRIVVTTGPVNTETVFIIQ